MNEPNLVEIRQRCEAATPGPWTVPDDEMIETTRRGALLRLSDGFVTEADVDFIAHAREDILVLLAFVDYLVGALRLIEAEAQGRVCRYCGDFARDGDVLAHDIDDQCPATLARAALTRVKG